MRETRFWRLPDVELRAAADGKMPTIAAYGAVFNRYSQNLGGFVEQLAPSAFADTLARGGDVHSYKNHDPNLPLGRTSAGNLVVSADSFGLPYEVTPPATTSARDLIAEVEAGLIRGSSFTFRVMPEGDSWSLTDQGFPLRTLHAVELYEVGPVTNPAYLDTETEGAQVALRSLAVRINRPAGEVLEAAGANELRSLLAAPIEQAEETDPAQHASWVTSARRRMELAARR
jgi:HK97 family phage prohead protease